jgi:hypothetical protein
MDKHHTPEPEADSAEGKSDSPKASTGQSDANEPLEAVIERLGPFQPDGHIIEPEFEPSPPRPIPAALRNGPFGRRFRRTTVATIGAGLICLGFAQTRLVEDLSWCFLPLGYLDWIGWAIIGLGILKLLTKLIRPGPYSYVRDGTPLTARVLKTDYFVETVKVEGGRTSRFGFAVDIQHPDPESGQLTCSQVRTETLADAAAARRFTCPFEPGDYVTAVCLPGRFAQSLRIYSLLGLNPNVPYICKDDKPWQPGMSWFTACAIVAGVMLGIWAITALLASFQFYWPISGPTSRQWMGFVPFAVVMGILGSLLMRWLLRREAANPNSIDRHKTNAWLAPLAGFVLAGGLLSTLLIICANAALDKSAPRYREIEIVKLWQTTHDLIFREYEIEYVDRSTREKTKHSARPEDLDRFATTRAGLVDIREGFLGMSWIRQICPVMVEPMPLSELSADARAAGDLETVEVTDPKTGKPGQIALVPVAVNDKDESLPISRGLQAFVLENLRKTGALDELREAIREAAETPETQPAARQPASRDQ